MSRRSKAKAPVKRKVAAPVAARAFVRLTPGDPAPWFVGETEANARFQFHTTAGRYVALLFFGSGAQPAAEAALRQVAARPGLFDGDTRAVVGVSIDPADRDRLKDQGLKVFHDADGAISRAYGAAAPNPGGGLAYTPHWVVLDPMLRVLRLAPLSETASLLDWMAALPSPFEASAPVLMLPRVFEPELCRDLIARYEAAGGEESGFMREIDGKTVHVLDHGFKRRKDHLLKDPQLIRAVQARITRRLLPQIEKVFQFKATRMERYLVACYEAETGGHFRPHRDNTTSGTAHRRFAVTLNLNAEDYEGGEMIFPEFGPRRWKPPTGGALVFSCGLLHTVTPMERGRRFAFLPFLYDDDAAKLRAANNEKLGEGVALYRDA